MCFAVKRGTNLDEIALKLCDIQGRLFELSANQKYDSIKFIRVFMNSDAVSYTHLDVYKRQVRTRELNGT